jgi:hypothetical protein
LTNSKNLDSIFGVQSRTTTKLNNKNNKNRKTRVSYIGYTNYWTYQPNEILDTEELRKKFLQAVCWINKAHKMIKRDKFIHKGQAGGFYDDQPCIIRGGLGQGKPMINESQVWFNGDAKKGLDHETFGIRWFPSGGEVKGFCKTARKPYDLLVCVSLLAFKHAFDNPVVFRFSSDGDNADWATAKHLFASIIIERSFDDEIFPEEAHLETA